MFPFPSFPQVLSRSFRGLAASLLLLYPVSFVGSCRHTLVAPPVKIQDSDLNQVYHIRLFLQLLLPLMMGVHAS
jgi:hypothetical protein